MVVLADSVLHTVLTTYSQAIAGMTVEGLTEFPHVFFTPCQDLCQSGVVAEDKEAASSSD